eukprot:3607279-Rhodomonas_salina.1
MLDDQEFDAAGLVRLMIQQAGEVGMTIKNEDEDEVHGVMSVTPMSQPSVLSLKQIGDFILAKCPESMKETFVKAISGKTGFIISEREPNTPVELAVPLLTLLLDDIQDAQNSQHEKVKNKYSFDSYLVLTKATRAVGRESGSGDAVTWLKAEDEAFFICARAGFEFEISQPHREGGEVVGKVMLVSARDLDA